MGCHFLLQGIFPTQGSNPGLSHCRWILYRLSHQESLNTQLGKLKLRGSFYCVHLKKWISSYLLQLKFYRNSNWDQVANLARRGKDILPTVPFRPQPLLDHNPLRSNIIDGRLVPQSKIYCCANIWGNAWWAGKSKYPFHTPCDFMIQICPFCLNTTMTIQGSLFQTALLYIFLLNSAEFPLFIAFIFHFEFHPHKALQSIILCLRYQTFESNFKTF